VFFMAIHMLRLVQQEHKKARRSRDS